MRVYFVRHGETDHNVDRRIQGPLLDAPLNARGLKQAAAIERRFADERSAGRQLSAVYASPLRRAYGTAKAVARGAGVPIVVVTPALVEFSWGEYLGRREDEILSEMQAIHAQWRAGNLDHAPPQGESPREAWERGLEALEVIFEKHRGQDVAVVAHGRLNKVLLSGLVHGDVSRMEEFPQGNASVTLLERDDDDTPWRVILRNDQSHLGDLAAASTPAAHRGPPLV